MENLDYCVQGQGHSKILKCAWVLVCPDDIFWVAEPFTTKLGMVMQHCETDFLPERLVCCLQGQGHSKELQNQNMTLQYVFWTADPFATKLGLMTHHHKLGCLVKRLDCSVVVKVKVTEKVQNSSECLCGRYLLNCWTFCDQTWYGDASSWARVSCKKIGLLSSKFRVTVKVHSIRYDFFYHICWIGDLFVTKVYGMVHCNKLECSV